MFLQALVSTGLIGALLLLWGLLRSGTTLLGSFRHNAENDRVILVALIRLAACWYLPMGSTTDSILGPLEPITVVFFAVLGTGLGSSISTTAETHRLVNGR